MSRRSPSPPGRATSSAPHGGVAAPRVVLADLADQQPLLAEERVGERALADARRADEDHGPPCAQEGPDGVEARAADRARRDDRDADGHLLELCLGDGNLDRIPGEVDLRQDNDRPRPRLPGSRQVALDAPRVEVAVERCRDEDDIDVGREHLDRRAVVGRCLAPQLGAPRQDDVNGRGALLAPGVDRDPIADDRQLGRASLEPEAAGDAGLEWLGVLAGRHLPGAAVGGNDPGRDEPGPDARERRLPAGIPAEGREPCQRRGGAHRPVPGSASRGRRHSTSRNTGRKPIAS